MKIKTVLILILALLIACVPCLISLAEDPESSSDAPASSVSAEADSSSGKEQGSESSESDSGKDSDGSDSGEEKDSDASEDSDSADSSSSSKGSKSSSSSESSSSGSRFTGDQVKGKTPKFAELTLGDCDPDDGKDFKLEPESTDAGGEVVIRNTEAKGMKGNDNFYIDFDGCETWIPIEIPASCVEDDHLNSKLVVSYGAISDSMMDKVTSSISSSQILQTFALSLTSYDVKGQPTEMNSFDGKIKFVCGVNAACVNQYNRDGKLALMLYNTESRSLSNVEYTLDAEKSEITVYASGSGSFFLINSEEIDTTTAIKLNSNAPFLKVVLISGSLMSIGASVALIALIIIKNRKNRSAESKK